MIDPTSGRKVYHGHSTPCMIIFVAYKSCLSITMIRMKEVLDLVFRSKTARKTPP